MVQAPDRAEATRQLVEFSERFAKRAAKAVACLEAGFEDAMAVMALREKYRRRLMTTHLQERLNEEIRRPKRVIRISPNDESGLRLIGACWPSNWRSGSTVCPACPLTGTVYCGHPFCKTGGITVFAIRLAK